MRSAAIAAALLVLSTGTAQARPSIWDEAREPESRRAYEALVAVERMIARAEEGSFDLGLRHNFTRAALAMLELAGGARLSDVRLKFLLADLLLDAGIGKERAARALLEEALAEAPESPLAGQAYFQLAIASAKLGDSAREHEAYTRALERIWQPDFRAQIHLNRAESRMVLASNPDDDRFTLEDALADYRRALELASRPDIQSLAYYGLGIALERNGNLPAALEAFERAASIHLGPLFPSALDMPGVFFVPAYDLFYYKALEAMALARVAEDVQDRIRYWDLSVAYWRRYLEEAEPEGHAWVYNARLHRASAEKQLDKLRASELGRSRARDPRPGR